MRYAGSYILLMCSLLSPCPGQAADYPWIPVLQASQGEIYHRRAGNSPFPWIMIRTVIAAPPGDVYGLVSDYDHFAGFVPNVAESRVLASGPGSSLVFHRLHFPGPVADRVYLMDSTDAASRPSEHYYRVEWTLSDRVFNGIDLSSGTRPAAFSGYWELQRGERPGTTLAEYAIHSDPGGLMPVWLVVAMTDRYVRQLVDAIRLRLAE